MNSKDKIKRVFDFKEGPVPIDFGAAPVTGIHCSIVEGLREYFGLEKRPVEILCPYQMLGKIDDDLKTKLMIDTDHIWGKYNMFGTTQQSFREYRTPWGQDVLISSEMVLENMPDGSVRTYPQGDITAAPSGQMPDGGFFFDSLIRQSSIDDTALNPEDNTEEYQPVDDSALQYYREELSRVDKNKWIIGNFGGTAIGDVSLVPAPQLLAPKGIRDVEEWYISTALRPDYLHKVFEKQVEIAIINLDKIYEVVGEDIDTVYVCGNDLGTQIAPLCSVDTYVELYKPYHFRINEWIHSNTGWKTFKHSCGAVEPFIAHFIDAGFDIVNPVQKTAAGMDLKLLKKKYGRDIVFWGGGVDTQYTLPSGSPEEVRTEVLETCEIMARDGGYVFNAIHNIQALTPVINIVAMIDAVREFNGN